MRVVADTNVVISGLLWGGPPNQIMKWARDGRLEILACERTAEELRRVIQYEKFLQRLSVLNVTPQEFFAYFMNLAHFVPDVEKIPNIIKADRFDNIFLAMAQTHHAHLITSGDRHLLKLKQYRSIEIVTPSEAVQVIENVWKV